MLRALTTNVDDYFDSVLHDFLVTLFERVVITSTQVELIFASLTKFTDDRKDGIGLPTLGAKYILSAYTQMVERWRSGLCPGEETYGNKKRPPWMFLHPPGYRTNHLHVLARTLSLPQGVASGRMSAVKACFDELPDEEKARLRAQARTERALAKHTPSRLDEALRERGERAEGPLGMATRSGEPFPLRPEAVSKALEGTAVKDVAKSWGVRHQSYAEPLKTFPDTVVLPEVCCGLCNKALYVPTEPGSAHGDLKGKVAHLWRYMQLACRFAATALRDPTILLRFQDCSDRSFTEFILVAYHCHDADSRFEATFFRMVPAGASPAFGQVVVPAPPFILFFDTQVTATGLGPSIGSEVDLLHRLLALSPSWEISQALNRRADTESMSRLVTEVEVITFARVCQLEEEAKTQAAALRALRAVMCPPAGGRGVSPGPTPTKG